jgi:hypothetical protein
VLSNPVEPQYNYAAEVIYHLVIQKLLISATKDLAAKLEEKLRYHYDVQLESFR